MSPPLFDFPVQRGAVAVVRAGGEEVACAPGTGSDDDFAIASVTKLVSTMATLAAVDAGMVALDDPVDGEGATVRHLLAHAAGYPPGLGGDERPVPRRPPGERRRYSNVGFRLLGEVVAAGVGSPFDAWAAEAVLEPLGMEATRLSRLDDGRVDTAAGGRSTLADLVRLARCLLGRGAPVVGAGLFAEAVSVQFPGLAGVLPGVGFFDPCDWGLGFELRDGKDRHWMGTRRSPQAFGHFGATGCFVWVDPPAGVAAVAVTDRHFDDGGWAMAAWPAWSDRLPTVA